MLGLCAVLTGVWFLLVQRFGEGNIYAVIGPYACAVSAVLIALRFQEIREWLTPDRRSVLIGLAVGVGMTLVTYPIFRLAASIVPSLVGDVQALYVGARSTTLPKAIAWVLAVIFAEELLFRGVLPGVLKRWLSEGAAYAISVIVYALAQYGTGSVIVLLMAFVCGTIWAVQRVYTGSLLSPLIAHLIWTPMVLLLYPVA